MASTNFTGTGKIVFDPELRFTPSGKAVWNARMVFRRARKDSVTGQWEEHNSPFFDVVAWGAHAENISNAGIEKGDMMIVTGQIEQQEWEKDGQKRYKYQINIEECGKAISKWQEDDNPPPQQQNTPDAGNNTPGSTPNMFGDEEPPF